MSPPPHPPCPSAVGIIPPALMETAGRIDRVHGVYLLGYRLIAFAVQGGKVDVQISKHDGQAAFWACHLCLLDVR